MASSPSLLIYLNSDVAMERPYRTTLPASVDTLAELCQFLTSRIPPRAGEDPVGRGYRFLYSILGKPLWRVKECLDAGTIVLSVGPGFLARRPSSITDGTHVDAQSGGNNTAPAADLAQTGAAAAAAAATTVVDLTTPDRLAATSRGGGIGDGERLRPDASPSASPPVKIPTEDAYSAPSVFFSAASVAASAAAAPPPSLSAVSATAGIAPSARSSGGSRPAMVEGTRIGQTNAAALESNDGGGRDSVDAAWPPAPSVRRPSQTDERERLVSITLNTATRGTRASSGNNNNNTTTGVGGSWGGVHMTQSTPLAATNLQGDGVERTPAVRLFTPPGATAAGDDSTRHSALPVHPPPPPPPTHVKPAPEPSAAARELPRGMVFIGHETHPLPPRPSFASSHVALQAVLPHLQPLPSSSISSTLQYLLLRKWDAYQKLHAMPPADLIAGEALSQQFNAITTSLSNSNSSSGGGNGGSAVASACRVLVSGPPRSGVSTTAAFLVRHLLRTLQFQPQHALHNTLVVALDFQLLFGPAPPNTPATHPPRLLLDLTSLYQLVIRTVLDAVVAQRPVLREAGPLLSQLWDLVVKPNTQPHVAPNFTTYTQAAALVGGDVLTRWTRLAEQVFPILQAACRTPEVAELRDAALDILFYAIPCELAASLNFSGVLYAVDGAEALTRCYAERVTRPAGDLGPLLQSLTGDARVHVVLSWPSTLAPRTLFIPGLTAHVSTVGLVTRAALNHMQFPQLIKSGRKQYPLEVFLGCPGYLTYLYRVVQPFRKNLTIPTTAYSAYYQQNYAWTPTDGYAIKIDSYEATQALDQLLALVQTLPVA